MLEPKEKTEEEKKEPETVSEEEQSEMEEKQCSALDKALEDPELKAEYEARIKEAVEAALKEADPAEDPEETEPSVDPVEKETQPEEEMVESDEQKRLDLDAREKNLLMREMRATAVEELSKEQLPAVLADCFNYESEESYQQSKEKVTKAFQDALKEAVNARLRGKKIPGTSGEGAEGSGNAKRNTFASIVRDNKRRR